MAKTSGLGDNLYLAGRNLSGDIGAVNSISGGPNPLDVTGIDKGGFERIGGQRDGSLEFSAFFNPAAGAAHPVLSALPTTDVVVTYCRGTALGGDSAALVGKQIDYGGARGDDGSFTFKVAAQANGYGLDWGLQLTAGARTDTAATNGASIDTTASAAFGLQAFLHVFAVTGTSVTVSIEDSADNVSFATVSGATFTAATGVTAQRIAVTGTVRRYLRAVSTGTFSNAQFAVMVDKNTMAVTF